MRQYHKIENVFVRDEESHKLIPGAWKHPEFEYLKDLEWDCFEKIDGTNIRVMWHSKMERLTTGLANGFGFSGEEHLHYGPPILEFRGKTDKAQRINDLYDNLGEMFTEDKMREVFSETEACLYGEGYGAGINKGGDYRDDKGFILFDIRIEHFWLKREDLEEIARTLEIPIVPRIDRCTLCEAVELVRDGFDSQMRATAPEGIVCKPIVDLTNRQGKRIVVKIKGKDFE